MSGPTIMSLGAVQFEITPFNATEYDHSHAATYVEKPVIGAAMPLEFVGAGSETWTIKARLFPHKFGGLGDLAKLGQQRASGKPVYLMRGDGKQMGWVVIESVTERSSYLDAQGVGKVIDVDIQVKRSPKPGAGSYFSVFGGMF